MIYCVVPEEMAPELYDKLVDYYAEDDNVKVIVDRRRGPRRSGPTQEGAGKRRVRDRRKVRTPAGFPDVE